LENIIVGIDIGTTKISTVIGKVDKENKMEVLGKGIEACNGVKKGIIVDIDNTSNSIRRSVEQAENMANVKVGSAYVNIAGTHVSVINNRCITNVSNEDREITAKDIDRALYSVKNVHIPEDREIIDIITRQYIVDGYDEIIDPVGMVGVKLEIDADIIAGKITSVQNIVKSLERANVKTDGIIVEALATAEMVLSSDEKDMGVILIDIGGGITDISVFKRKNLIFYESIPVGGDHISNDISIGLKIPYAEADRVKKEYELALTSLIKNDQDIMVNDINGNNKKSVKISEVVEIIEARVFEIFSLCSNLIEKANLNENIGAGIVLTGAGISYLDGGREIAAEAFNLPVRIATCRHEGIQRIEYITAGGIIKYIAGRHKGSKYGSEIKYQKQKAQQKDNKIFDKISKFFKSIF
jgi:cell division protein FtsA